jgi:hypothetical protein
VTRGRMTEKEREAWRKKHYSPARWAMHQEYVRERDARYREMQDAAALRLGREQAASWARTP